MVMIFWFFFGRALLFLLIHVLTKVHDAADGGCAVGETSTRWVLFLGNFERVERCHDAKLLTLIVDHANFADANALIGADKTFIDTILRWY